MSLMNIAIIGGVVLLVLMLVKMRRDKGADPASKSGKAPKGRGRGRRDRKAPPAPPEPMPLAAAAGAVSPVDEPDAPRWPEELGEDEWPPAPAQEPVAAWPPPAEEQADQPFADGPFADGPFADEPQADAPFADEPYASEEPAEAPAPAAPVAQEPVPAPVAAPAWADDEIVTDPGWPLPGEVDGGWSGASEQHLAAAGPAWVEQAATTAGPAGDVEWLGDEQAVEEEIPPWAPPAGEVAGDAADEVPEWEAAQQEVPEWEAPAASPAAEEPAGAPDAWEAEADMPAWEPLAEEAEQPTGEFAAPSFDAPVAEEPAFDEPSFGEPVYDEPVAPAVEAVEEVAFDEPSFEEPSFEESSFEESSFEESSFEEPSFEEPSFEEPAYDEPAFEEASFDLPAFEEPAVEAEPIALVAEAQVAAEVAPAEVAPVAEQEPAGEPVAWWDEEDPSAVSAGPPAEASSGRWALGGFAAQPGQHALGGVQFREELAEAPTGWALAPALDAGPGTLVLVIDGAINSDGEGVEVVTDPGFAPTPQGFTVRVAATASGPFAASGTFHVL